MRFGINNADDRTICGRVFSFERKARFLSPAPEHQLTDSGTNGINATSGLPCGSRSLIQRLHDEQLTADQRFVLRVATTVPITRASCIKES